MPFYGRKWPFLNGLIRRPAAEQVEMADGTYMNPFMQGCSYGIYRYGAEPHTPSSVIGQISLYSQEELIKHAHQ